MQSERVPVGNLKALLFLELITVFLPYSQYRTFRLSDHSGCSRPRQVRIDLGRLRMAGAENDQVSAYLFCHLQNVGGRQSIFEHTNRLPPQACFGGHGGTEPAFDFLIIAFNLRKFVLIGHMQDG